MPTYAELGAEPWWGAEYEPEHFAAFLSDLRTFYGHTRSQTGAKGDYRHLTGRHRSIAWCLNSKYCTNRTYGTRDQRDLRGDRNALRGFDLGVRDAELRAVSTRVDKAVRAGLLPELAEWFGTKDGTTVVGWFEGHASSSDSSHLWHFHGGIWTESVNDKAFLDRLYATITGDEMTTLDDTFDRGDGGRTSYANGIRDTVWALRRLEPMIAGLETPQVDAGAVAAALASNADFLAALAKAVNDDAAARLAG